MILTGAAPDLATSSAILSFAAAAFSGVDIQEGLTVAETGARPSGWRAAALAALEALAALDGGSAEAARGAVTLEGAATEPDAVRRVAEAMAGAREAGWDATSRVTVDQTPLTWTPTLAPADCARRLTGLAAEDPILFEPGEAAIEAGSAPALDALAEILRGCSTSAEIEVQGHTDSQGSEGYNERISRARAEAVRAALNARGAPEALLTARGYGESRPIATTTNR
jgi:Outer membrane protein and related peptidoglycan-associated (lipo)proteins